MGMSLLLKTRPIRNFTLTALLVPTCLIAIAQNPLNKRITIEANNTPTIEILAQIEQQSGFNFTYNSKLISYTQQSSVSANNRPIRYILDKLFEDRIDYKLVNNHIILTAANENFSKSRAITLSGFISDQNEDALESAIIYIVEANTTAITNSHGSFDLNLKSKNKTLSLNISHPNCPDTTVYIETASQSLEIKLNLQQHTEEIGATAEPFRPKYIETVQPNLNIDSLRLVSLLVSPDALYVSNNLNIYNPKAVQVSLLPFIGTNLLAKGIQTNNLSFNILAGYSQGLNGVEIGGLVNINRKDVEGVQIAGLSSINGGNTSGIQIAGIVNVDNNSVDGVQIAGVTNVVHGNLGGVQVAGIANTTTGHISGIQVAGIVNMNCTNRPMRYEQSNRQVAGILNVDRQNPLKFQLSGIANISSHSTYFQGSGYVNLNNDTIKAIQASSALNYARVLKGAQIGLVNIADTSSGFQIGFINIVKHGGFKAIELTANETNYINATIKTGGRNFYTLLNAGVGEYTTAGFGFGVTTNPFAKFSTNIEATPSLVFNSDSIAGVHARLQVGLCYNFNKHIGIITGASANVFAPMVDKEMENSPRCEFQTNSNSLIAKSIEDEIVAGWFGWFLGLRVTF